MLLEHILTGYPFGPDQMYYDLQTQFDLLGYPEKCRRIALSNGNATNNEVHADLAGGLNTSAYNPLDEILTITNNTSSGTRINIHCMAQTNTAPLQIAVINVGVYIAGEKVRDIIKGNLLHQSYLDYDNSPGGFLTTQRFIVQGVQTIGFFSGSTATTNNRDQHCMIPMTSAIDLKCPQCTTLVQNHTPNYYLDNFLTPFDNIFFYGEEGNYGHADNIERHASWFILDELLDHLNVTGPPTSDTYLKSPLSTTYNFGTLAHNVIVGSLTINSGGKLQINGNYSTYYGSGPTPAGGSAQYSVYSAPCSTNVISIQGGGTIEVGDQYSSSHKGNLVISDQSTLELENDGELIVRAGSRVVIKPGGKLNFKEGAIINLASTTSVLEIQGELVLGNNANFTITGSGYIKFSLPDGTTAQSIPITASNSNCTFVLSTNNQTNKVMEVTKGWVTPSSNLALFKIYKGTVELGTDAYLNLGCKTEINNTTITSNVGSGYVHKGVKLGNQSVSDITIRYSNFFNAKTALWWGSSGSGTLTILGTQFQNCDKALHTVGNGVDIKNVRFIECNTAAWLAESMTGLSDFSGYVEDCANGLVYSGTTGADLFITTTQFNTNTFSVIADGDITITSKCSKYEGNVSDFVLSDGCTLNLSTTQTVTRIGSGLPSNQDVGGNNKFINSSSEVVYATDIYDILLDEGYNSFTYSGTPGTILFGSLSNSFYSNSNNHLDVTDNYWSLYAWVGTPNPSLTLIHYPTSSNIELEYSANNNDIAFDYSPELVSAPTSCNAWNGIIAEEEGDPEGVRQGDGTGVKPVADLVNRLSIYPNPANNRLNLRTSEKNHPEYQLKLIDISGRIIQPVVISQNGSGTAYDISGLAPGLYQCIIEENGIMVYKNKLVIIR
jgi:hypothetical protein